MKRKFILLPITLTALAPAISLVGCGDPDTPEPTPSEYKDVEMILSDVPSYRSEICYFKKNMKYHLWLKDFSEEIIEQAESFYNTVYLYFNDVQHIKPDVVVDDFLLDGASTRYDSILTGVFCFKILKSSDIDVYITFNKDYWAYFEFKARD